MHSKSPAGFHTVAVRYCTLICLVTSVSDPYSFNPDPAENLNTDPVPDPDPSYWYFSTLYEKKLKLLYNYISHQKKSIERWNVAKVTKKGNYVFDILTFLTCFKPPYPDLEDP